MQQELSPYWLHVPLEMLPEVRVFCDRCETRVAGTVTEHLDLHAWLLKA